MDQTIDSPAHTVSATTPETKSRAGRSSTGTRSVPRSASPAAIAAVSTAGIATRSGTAPEPPPQSIARPSATAAEPRRTRPARPGSRAGRAAASIGGHASTVPREAPCQEEGIRPDSPNEPREIDPQTHECPTLRLPFLDPHLIASRDTLVGRPVGSTVVTHASSHRRRTAALLLLGGALLLLALLTPGRAAAASNASCADAVVADWYGDGRVDQIYPIHCYTDAIRSLPVDVLDYSNAKEDILRALSYAKRGQSDPGDAGAGSGNDGGNKGGGDTRPRRRRSPPEARRPTTPATPIPRRSPAAATSTRPARPRYRFPCSSSAAWRSSCSRPAVPAT